ncbi:MAG: lipocalin-like domain-containing protein, partial [Rhodospirillales bacterium]|nr:lipocalin-like domain-containing protein [Rhodospirillales bacterium]
MAETLLTGTWKCVSWENRDAAGKVDYPLGKDIIGYITYTPDGHILVQLMAAERPLIPDGELFACTGEETIAAANSHVSYCGTYEIQPGGI